jgi:hypothetical protein
MLFNEILKAKYEELAPLFDDLFDLAINNQTHSGDLLLVMENGFLTEEPDTEEADKFKLFYNIGPNMEYHCETANHDFIRQYVRSVVDMSYDEYKKLHEYTQERSEEIKELQFVEGNSIQVEMLIYLKIWEGETFLKKIYQVSQLITGNDYDWHLKIAFGKSEQGSMPRRQLINVLKLNLQKGLPAFYDVIERIHRSHLRNAVAHSQYALLGRNILLDNQKPGRPDSDYHISFDEWVDIFHETLTIFTLYEMFFARVRTHYFEAAKEFNLKKEVRITRRFPMPKQFHILLYSRDFFEDWSPYSDHK